LKAGECVRRVRFVIVAPDPRHSRRSQAGFPLIALSEFGRPPLFRAHPETTKLVKSISRFRALEPDGLFALAKDLMRIVADRIDHDSLQKVAPPPKGEKWGSLKSLEKYLGTIISVGDARKVMGPLAGAYDLRLADAHLAKADLNQAYELVQVDPNAKPLEQEFWLIAAVVSALMEIGRIMTTVRKAQERRA
jgi:hypothetical protein